MKFVYLVEAFDVTKWRKYLPDPCIFETKEEADKYCEFNENIYNKDIIFAYKKLRVGKYKA
jgi:hypothetical protein